MAQKLRTEQQKILLASLSQGAAAWAVSLSSRQLRDAAGVPRNEDDTYDISQLVKWLISAGYAAPGKSRDNDNDAIDDRARKLRGEADMIEVKVEKAAEQLIDKHETETFLLGLADSLREMSEEFGRMSQPITGKEVQRKINHFVSRIE